MNSMNSKPVIEWAQFQLVENVSEEELVRSSEALQRGFLEKQPGFMRRELLRGKGRCFVDLVYWRDQASADEAMKTVMESSVCQQYFKLMTPPDASDPNAGVLHYQQVAVYPSP